MQACRCPEWRLRILEHELSARTERFGEWRLASVRAGELFFEALTGELTFHGCPSLSPGIWRLHPIAFYRKLRTSTISAHI